MRLRLKQGRPRGMHLGKERPALNGGRVKNIGPHRRENEVSRLSPKRRLYQKHAFMNMLVIRSIIFLRFFDLRRIYIYTYIRAHKHTRENRRRQNYFNYFTWCHDAYTKSQTDQGFTSYSPPKSIFPSPFAEIPWKPSRDKQHLCFSFTFYLDSLDGLRRHVSEFRWWSFFENSIETILSGRIRRSAVLYYECQMSDKTGTKESISWKKKKRKKKRGVFLYW